MDLARLLFVATFLASGCRIIEPGDVSETAAPKSVRWVSESRSIEGIDLALPKLLSADESQANVEMLLSDWGKFDDWYDLAVVKFLWEHWPSYYGDADVDPERLIPIIQSRIKAKPELNRQVYWYVQWKNGPMEFPVLCERVNPASFALVDKRVAGEEFRDILFIAGLTNNPSQVLTASWDNLYLHWNFCALEFLSQRPFLKYDSDRGHYVVDGKALETHQYLDAKQQNPTPRQTPLPNWTSSVIPKNSAETWTPIPESVRKLSTSLQQ